MSKQSSPKEQHTSQPPTPPRWRGRDSVELVHRLNERALTLLKPSGGPQRELLEEMDGPAIQRAARLPFLIVDVRFADDAWWRAFTINISNPESRTPVPVAGLWPLDLAKKLISEVVVFAFHTARWDRSVARLALGMAPGVVEIVRGLNPEQLDALPELHAGALRLRWQDDGRFWSSLLHAARDNDEDVLAGIHLHAKLLLSGALART